MSNDARVKARVVRGGLEAHILEDSSDCVVPMMGATAEAIESRAEQPIFVGGMPRVTNGRTDDGEFVIREVGLTKRVFTVALMKDAFVANCF